MSTTAITPITPSVDTSAILGGGGAPEVTPSVTPEAGAGGEDTPSKLSFELDGGESFEIDPKEFESEEHEPEELSWDKLKTRFKEDDPEQQETYKSLKKPFSEYTRFKKHFPTPEAASEHLERLSTLATKIGGEPGKTLESLERYVDATNSLITGLTTADTTVIDKLWKDKPADLSKFVQAASDHLYTVDTKAWQAQYAKEFMNTLMAQDAKGDSAWSALVRAYDAGDENVKAALMKAFGVLNAVQRAAQFKPQGSTVDPAIAAQQKQLADREMAVFKSEAKTTVSEIRDTACRKALNQWLAKIPATKQPNASQINEQFEFMQKEFLRLIEADKKLDGQIGAAMQSKSVDQIKQLVSANKNRIMQDVLKSTYKKYYMPSKTAVRAENDSRRENAGGTTAVNTKTAVKYKGPLMQGQIPSNVLDYPRMKAHEEATGQNLLMDGLFFVKGKKELYTL